MPTKPRTVKAKGRTTPRKAGTVSLKKSALSGGEAGKNRKQIIRRSVSLDAEVDALAHDLAGNSDFSSFVNEALRREIQRTQMLSLLRDLDEEFGPVGEPAKANAERLWEARSR